MLCSPVFKMGPTTNYLGNDGVFFQKRKVAVRTEQLKTDRDILKISKDTQVKLISNQPR